MFRNASASSRRVLSQATHAVMEPMDGRQLYSATLINSGMLAGTLVIDGTSKADKIDLSLSHRSDGLYVNVTEQGKNPVRFKSSQVKMVIANLGNGDDQFDGRVIAQPIIVHAGDGKDYVLAGKGNDTLNGNAGSDYLNGMEGTDLLTGHEGNDTLAGGANNDTMIGQAGADNFQGNSGFDTVDYRQHTAPIQVKIDYAANDGSVGEGDFIAGDVENVIGTKFNDYMLGDNYTQMFSGMQGHDTLNGGGGNDSLYGGEGNDQLQGSEGNDYLEGSSGADTLRGGNGTDSVELKRAPAAVRISLDNVANDGRDDGNDAKTGNKYADDYGSDIEVVYGTEFADVIVGSSADNTIYGMGGNDILNGGHGNDKIYGGAGDDNLYGDEGLDTLSGEAGHDGLYGGREWADKLYGGEGRDRFLVHMIQSGGSTKFEDTVADKSGYDVNIKFYDHFAMTNGVLPGFSQYTKFSFAPNDWKENEVERVDAVLSGANHLGGGARIFSVDGKDVSFWRTGKQTAGYPLPTFSLGENVQIFGNYAVEDTRSARLFVSEAVGTNLAYKYANLFASDNGWKKYTDLRSYEYDRYSSGDAGWSYRRDADFVNSDAKTRPTYDMVETFKKVVHDDQGWANDFNDASAKEQWFETYPLKTLRA